ncbi:MAG: helix-turn-helix domain-containing protein [Gloeotrichia echinulata HAB0833]
MTQLYTTPEAAKLTGIPESTIRSWMRRHAKIFHTGIHVVVEKSGRKMWTDAGIELLQSRNASIPALADDAETDADNLLEIILDHDASQIAKEYWRQLPARVLFRIKQMRNNPTPEERELVQSSFRAAITAGTYNLLLPTYQPILQEGESED